MRNLVRVSRFLTAVALSVLLASTAAHGQSREAAAAPAPLPTPETAATILAQSPRHGEWLNVKSGVEIVRTYIVHPVRKDRGPCVIVVAEGMDDWARAIGDRLALDGFTALVADVSTNSAEMGRKPSPPSIGTSLRALKPDVLAARMQSVWDYATRLPAVNEKVAVVSFGWGVAPAVAFAQAQPALAGTVIFFGSMPSQADLSRIKTPILPFYATDDKRTPANLTAVQQNWASAIDFIKQHTS